MKFNFSALLICLPFLAFAQEKGKLPPPSKQLMEVRWTEPDIGFLYLKENWAIAKAKEVDETVPSDTDSVDECAWNVQFKGGISYNHNSCHKFEKQLEITFVGVEKEEVRGLINTLFHSEASAWKDNNSKYEPIDGGSGCYYEIIENGDTIKLKYSCGC